MTVACKVGSFAMTTSDNNQTIDTGLGVVLSAIRFISINTATTPDTVADILYSRGFSDGTRHRVYAMAMDSLAEPSEVNDYISASYCIVEMAAAGTVTYQGKVEFLTGADAGKFKITWFDSSDVAATPAVANTIQYQAFAGVTAYVGTAMLSASTNPQDFTDAGFTVTYLEAICRNVVGTGLAVHALPGHYIWAPGTVAASYSATIADNHATTCDPREGYDDGVWTSHSRHDTSVNWAGTPSAITGGFRLTYTNQPNGAYELYYLAFGGVVAHIAVHLSPLSVGLGTLTYPGFTPLALIGFHLGRAVDDGDDADAAHMSMGMATSTSVEQSVSFISAYDNTDATSRRQTTNFYENWHSGTSLYIIAEISTMGATGYQLNWTSVTASYQRRVAVVALGETVVNWLYTKFETALT